MTRQSTGPRFNSSRRRVLRQGLITSAALSGLPGFLGQTAFGFHEVGIKKHDISNISNLSNILHEVSVENDPDTRMYAQRDLLSVAQQEPPMEPRLAFVKTPVWGQADQDTHQAFAGRA